MKLHDINNTLRLGAPLSQARAAVILVHGRGSSAEDIAGLADVFGAAPLAYLAPEATNQTWYPHRFIVPPAQNEPWLGSALDVVGALVAEALVAGVPPERVALVGFSQGACLVLEYAARHPKRYGFVAALSGALIGPTDVSRDAVDMAGTPVLIGCAERDAHIPLANVKHSSAAFAAFNARVTEQIFPGAQHTVFPEEIAWLEKHAAALS